jgi:hypothetical protein
LNPTRQLGPKEAVQRAGQIIERRREARYPTSDPAAVQILAPDGARVSATVVNVSRSGLRLKLRAPLAKGMRIEVVVVRKCAIFGEVRYCSRTGDLFFAGIQIDDVVHSRPNQNEHLSDDQLSLYLVGKGLSVPEVIQLKDHLIDCEACQIRLAEQDAILNPRRRRKIGDSPS